MSIIIYTFKFTLFVRIICVLDANVVCRVVLVSSCAAEDCTRFVGSNVDGRSVVEDAIGWCFDDGWTVIVVVVVWVVVSDSVVTVDS